MNRNHLGVLAALTLIGCGHSRGSRPMDSSHPAQMWHEISEDQLSSKPRVPWSVNYWQRYRALPSFLQRNSKMARLAAFREMQQVESYDLGIWGRRDGAGLFATTTDRIKNSQRLYWVMVKALSEKYGCFMRERQTYANVNHFRCRDRRHVVFWQNKGSDWIEFFGKQYNQYGDEIRVVNHNPVVTGRKLAQDVILFKPQR